MKIEWWGPFPEQNVMFWVILDICWPIQAAVVVGEPFCDARNPLLSPNNYLRFIKRKKGG